MHPRLFVVIVLYRVSIESCVSYRDLMRAVDHLDGDDVPPSVLIYDNSPEPQPPPELPIRLIYHHAGHNRGVAGAYNYALRLALAEGADWLLTLDQDTNLPTSFLVEMSAAARSLASDKKIAAVVPRVFSNGRMISPHFYTAGAWPRYLPAGFSSVFGAGLFAINSASLLRVSMLDSIGGYDPAFWLDASDHVLFARLARSGYGVYVLGSLRVQQSLSHLDKENPLSPERLANILASESAFWDSEMTYWAGAMHTVVLMRHLVGMWRRGESRVLRKLVLRSIFDRIAHTRSFRLKRWRQSLITTEREGY